MDMALLVAAIIVGTVWMQGRQVQEKTRQRVKIRTVDHHSGPAPGATRADTSIRP